MAISSLGIRTSNTTINTASWELRTSSAAKPKMLELTILLAVANASSYGFGRPAAVGVTPVNTLFQMDDPNDPASVNNVSTSWVTSPTAPPIYMRRWNCISATVGVGIVWTFPRGLTVPISSSMVIFNITSNAVTDVNCVLDE